MSEDNPVLTPPAPPTAPPAAEPQPYRPLSLLALAGLALGALYVLMVAAGAIVALIKGTPLFLSGWTLAVAVAAVVVSLLGQWHIKNAEGTRAGLALAHWGLGLSLFFGVGYTVYQYFTGLALIRQANDFLMVEETDSGFFPRLRSGNPAQANYAFLLTKPAGSRGNIDPRDEQKMSMIHDRADAKGKGLGALTMFRGNILVRAVSTYGKQTHVEPLGVQSWNYENHGYKVMRNYRITTPEMNFEVVLPVLSTEGAEGERKWFLAFPAIDFKSGELTELGARLVQASQVARMAVTRLSSKPLGAFPDATDWAKAVPDAPWEPVRDEVKKRFIAGGEHNIHMPESKGPGRELPDWSVDPASKRLQFSFDIRYSVRLSQNNGRMGEGKVTVENKNPVELDADGLPVPGSIPISLDDVPGEQASWRISSIRFGRLAEIGSMRPPQ